jgi:hypothetical protein
MISQLFALKLVPGIDYHQHKGNYNKSGIAFLMDSW